MHAPSLSDGRSLSRKLYNDDDCFIRSRSHRRVSLGALEVTFKAVSLRSPSPAKRRQSLNCDFICISTTTPFPSTPKRSTPLQYVPPAPARLRQNVHRSHKQDLKFKDLQSRLSFITRRYHSRRSQSQSNIQPPRRRTSFIAALLPSLPVAGDNRAECSMFGATPFSYMRNPLCQEDSQPTEWEAQCRPPFEPF